MKRKWVIGFCLSFLLLVPVTAAIAITGTLTYSITSSSGPPASPTPAQQAGLTTCIICMDWTVASGGVWTSNGTGGAASQPAGVNAAQTNTWLACAGASSPLFYDNGNTGPCGSITTDGANGQVLLQQYSNTDGAPHGGSLFGTSLLTYCGGFCSERPGAGILVPTNTYSEATYKVASFPNLGYSQGHWQGGAGEVSDTIYNHLEFDANEINTNIAAGAYTSGMQGWGGLQFTCGPAGSCSNWYGTFPPNYDSFNITTQYLKIGQRTTSDGTSLYKCMWINDVFQNCVYTDPSHVSSGSLTAALSDATSRMQAYFVLVGSYDPSFVGTMIAYAKSYNIWACANWSTTACKSSSANPGNY